MLRKLQQWTQWEKISKSWRKTTLIQQIGSLIKQIQYLIPSHVRRTGNVAADYLANWGCHNVGRQLDVTPSARIWNVELHPL